ncbi:hypothetical protein GCM10009117_08470 [Gangjinia marincola]|uniref:ADP,ATP carrier protein n=1 Tax=Gangjinia marincola TaxID=578463 RepID=A0ABP3XUM5_9FLAO
MRHWITKLFDLKEGETRITLLMQGYIFLLITVLLIVKPTVNAVFLSQLGASNLPWAFLLLAVTAIISSYFYTLAVQRFRLIKVIQWSIVFFSLSFFLLSYLLHLGVLPGGVLYAYYVLIALFAVLTTSQFWLLGNTIYNAREAKRLFGFIGAGAIAGGIAGGYLTSIFVPILGNANMIIIAGVLLISCLPVLNYIYRHKLRTIVRQRVKHRVGLEKTENVSSFTIIKKSGHLTLLASIVGVGVIVAKLVDYQFSDFAQKEIPETAPLTAFFGFWFSTFNVIALLIQLFLTNKILKYIGVTSTLLLLPLGIAIGSLMVLTVPELWVLIIIKGLDGSFKQSIHKAATELSIFPIPYHLKNKAKSYIDVVVDSIATGIAGFLLLFIVKRLNLSSLYVTVIILFFLFVWLVLIYRLRGAYFNSFRKNIQRGITNDGLKNKRIKSLSAAKYVLQSKDDQQIAHFFKNASKELLFLLKGDIILCLQESSDKTKRLIINALYNFKKNTAKNEVMQLVEHSNPNLVQDALKYELTHTSISFEGFFGKYLDHTKRIVRDSALVLLAKYKKRDNTLALKFQLDNRIKAQAEEITFQHLSHKDDLLHINQVLKVIAHAEKSNYYILITQASKSEYTFLVKGAIKAMGISRNHDFIDDLLLFLRQALYEKEAIQALRKFGDTLAEHIIALYTNEELNPLMIKHLPSLLFGFTYKLPKKIVSELLYSKKINLRLETFKAIQRSQSYSKRFDFIKKGVISLILKECTYYMNTAMVLEKLREDEKNNISQSSENAASRLVDIIQKQRKDSFELLFKLLKMHYESADLDMIYTALRHGNEEAQTSSLELLENLVEFKLKNEVLGVVDYQLDRSLFSQHESLKANFETTSKCLAFLLKNRGAAVKSAVLDVILEHKYERLIPHVSKLKEHHNKKISLKATQVVDHFAASAKV